MSSDIHGKDKQLYTVSDLLEWTPPKRLRIISNGILNVKNKMLIFGDEGSWKSVLALHTAHSISRGSPWLGFKTYPCNVLRLQVELPMYTDRARIEKYCLASKEIYIARHKDNIPEPDLEAAANHYAYPYNAINRTEQFIHIDEVSGWESLRKNIETCIMFLPEAPLVVILDPLYKMFNRDLNNEQDLKVLLDKADIVMEDFSKYVPGISFIIIHHTRKSKAGEYGQTADMGIQDASNSRSLVKWVDTAIRVYPEPHDKTRTKVKMVFLKHRNAETVLPEVRIRWDRLTLHPQILGRDYPLMEEDENLEERGEYGITALE